MSPLQGFDRGSTVTQGVALGYIIPPLQGGIILDSPSPED